MGSRADRQAGVPPSPAPSPGSSLTKAAGGAQTVEHASLQGSARGPTEAGVGQARVVPTRAHTGAPGHGPLPAAELQPLVVHIQEADAAPEADTDGGPFEHPAARRRVGVRGQRPRHPLPQPAVPLAPLPAGLRAAPYPRPCFWGSQDAQSHKQD